MTNIRFTSREMEILRDTEFLITKRTALAKIDNLLAETQSNLKMIWETNRHRFPELPSVRLPKISRGENYRGLPWRVLDYPAIFEKEDIFAFRTMFWWGNFFSITLHLQGKYLREYSRTIYRNHRNFRAKPYFVSTGESPWEYHYEKDNYLPADKVSLNNMDNLKFLKISTKLSLDNWNTLEKEAGDFLSAILPVLKD